MSLAIWKEECQKVYDRIKSAEPDADESILLGSMIIILNYEPRECSRGSEGCCCKSSDFDEEKPPINGG